MPADFYEEALRIWQDQPPAPATPADVIGMLEARFGAYEIPMSAMSRLDWARDREVREDLVDRLFTITDRRVLASLISEGQELPSSEEAESTGVSCSRSTSVTLMIR